MTDRCRTGVSVVAGLCLIAVMSMPAQAMRKTGSTSSGQPAAAATITRSSEANATLYAAYLRRFGMYASADLREGVMRNALAMHREKLIPAFARKYNLPCSACHTTWPQLNNFGQVFRDNGYRLKNERDSPIDTHPAYWPVAMRITPQWRMDRTDHQPVDLTPGDPESGQVERTITQSGFDLSGIDILALGTLSQNISFGLIPASDNTGSFHIEAAYVRFDDLNNSTWANFKAGKFELDNLISEKRELLLSGNGGFYQSYHFVAPGDGTSFGLGDNQIGAEFSGHSLNSYTRYSVGVFSSTDGDVGLAGGKGYDGAVALSTSFEAGSLGLERIGVFGYSGSRPTTFETVGGEPVPGSGTATKPFYRAGVAGDFYFGKLELLPLVMHAQDDKSLAGGTVSPVWNSGLVEAHFFVHQQLVLMARQEMIRMSKQSDPAIPKELGNTNATAIGFRWYPIMLARDGLAFHGEYSLTSTTGIAPLSGFGSGQDPLDPGTKVKSSSIFVALDFAF